MHATSVAVGGAAILIRGPSGSGKSDLALRLIDAGAMLVSDDQTELVAEAGALVARAPARLSGKLEIRGLGIVEQDASGSAPVALIVDLVAADETVERLPKPETATIEGVTLPVFRVRAFEASAAAKVRAALDLARRDAPGL